MQPNNLSPSKWQPLPPVRHIDISRRIGWLNIPFALFYLFYFVWTLLGARINNFEGTGIPIYFEIAAYFACSVSLLLGGILLLREKPLGKRLVQLAGIVGSLTIVVFGVWSLTFLWTPPYDAYPASVIENFFSLTIRYTLRFAYPIIASVILAKKSNEDLGLK